MRTARADDGAIRHLGTKSVECGFTGREHDLGAFKDTACGALNDKGLHVATPKTGMHDIGL